MTLLPALERELLEAHARLAARPHRRFLRWVARQRRRSGAALVLVAAALVITGGAAASELLFSVSSPVPPAPQPYAVVQDGAPPRVGGPTPAEAAQLLRQIGRPLASTASMYVLQPDPAGGPPWGVLVYRTTTGVVCSHSGRVVQGRVGLIDAHHGLHPWRADLSGCDVGTNVRVVDAQAGVLRWGGGLSCVERAALATLHARQGAPERVCSTNEVRGIMDGVLPNKDEKPTGSLPIRITFFTASGTFTEPTPQGAFVYVNQGGFGCRNWPRITITYADGSTGTDPGLILPGCARIALTPQGG